MNTKTLRDIDVQGKRVLMRVDFNVPVKEGKIKDDTRIVGALPSIQYVIEHGGRLILMSHMGRPDEKGITADTTMKIVADALAEKLGKPVAFAADCAAADAEVAAQRDRGDLQKRGNLVNIQMTAVVLADHLQQRSSALVNIVSFAVHGIAPKGLKLMKPVRIDNFKGYVMKSHEFFCLFDQIGHLHKNRSEILGRMTD